jgi:PPOX class probable F420-dependent enzyme
VLFYYDEGAGRVLVHTGHRSGKVKRMMRNPEVMIEEADIIGRPRGPRMRGRARVLEGDERDRALKLVTGCCLEKLISYLLHDVIFRKKSDVVEIVPEDP